MRGLIVITFAFLSIFSGSKALNACCGSSDAFEMDDRSLEEEEFYAFVSFSIPESSLKEISKHLERIGGSFVFRGMPNGSFNAFILKVKELREKDILAPILVDPDLFNEYAVTEVPTFVYLLPSREILSAEELSRAFEDTSYPKYKKIVGNVSVPFVLREMGVEL